MLQEVVHIVTIELSMLKKIFIYIVQKSQYVLTLTSQIYI
jgi:hypothetical protein